MPRRAALVLKINSVCTVRSWGGARACGLDGEDEVVLALAQLQVAIPPLLAYHPAHLHTPARCQPSANNFNPQVAGYVCANPHASPFILPFTLPESDVQSGALSPYVLLSDRQAIVE